MNLRRFAGAAAGLLLLSGAAVACSDDESVFNAEAGECIKDVTDLSGQISEIPEAECTEDHNGEVIGLFEHDDEDDFPGTDQVNEDASEACQGDIFEDYTGTSYDESAIVVQPITPTEDSWDDGDRESICVAATGEDIDVSFKDNGEDFLLGGGSDSGDSGDDSGDSGDEEDSGDDTTETTLSLGGLTQDEIDSLVDDCEGGDNGACDDLYNGTDIGTDEEEIGSTCAGRSDEPLAGTCEAELG